MAKRIYIVDDHPLVRQGLSQVINNEEDMEICGEAEDAPETMKGVGPANPDVIIVDISLRGNNGLELIKNLKAIHENIPILVFSMHDESIYAQRALRAGAKAFVMKKESPTKVVEAIRCIIKGEIYVSPTQPHHNCYKPGHKPVQHTTNHNQQTQANTGTKLRTIGT